MALHIKWSKYWSFSFSISPFNEYSGSISCRIDWLDLLAIQRTLKSLLQPQFKSISSSALSLFYAQLSHLYMTNGKIIALTIWTFLSNVISLLFNTLSWFVLYFQGVSVF